MTFRDQMASKLPPKTGSNAPPETDRNELPRLVGYAELKATYGWLTKSLQRAVRDGKLARRPEITGDARVAAIAEITAYVTAAEDAAPKAPLEIAFSMQTKDLAPPMPAPFVPIFMR